MISDGHGGLGFDSISVRLFSRAGGGRHRWVKSEVRIELSFAKPEAGYKFTSVEAPNRNLPEHL